MAGEDSTETASAAAREVQPEFKGLMAAGFLLLVALVVFVHLLVIYRS